MSKRKTSPGPGEGPEMLTIAEVAQELRVCERSVRRWIENGELRRHKFGRAIRVSRHDLEDFKRARRK